LLDRLQALLRLLLGGLAGGLLRVVNRLGVGIGADAGLGVVAGTDGAAALDCASAGSAAKARMSAAAAARETKLRRGLRR
jgi:hypothetical protein